jgi:trehalose 6-phosphate phosphatase
MADQEHAIRIFANALESGLSPQECGFFFDFDGTLAPIQLDPETVQPIDGVASRLAALAAGFGRVALVSARPAAYLRSRFRNASNIHYFGLYGLESAIDGSDIVTHPVAESYSDRMALLADAASAELPEDVGVERKRLTVALHYRANPALVTQVRDWARVQADEQGLVLQEGRMVCELKPPGTPDKGVVVTENSTELKFVWYFGDDIGDVPAFESLAKLNASREDFTALLIAVHNPESGSPVAELATTLLSGPAEVPGFLDRIMAAARAARPHG